jgi:hypothetical protein
MQAPQSASVAQVIEVKTDMHVPVTTPNSQAQTPVASTQVVVERERVNILEAKLQELKSKVAESAQSAVVKPVIDTPIYAEVKNAPEQVERRVSPELPSMPSVAKNKQLQDLLRSNRDKEISAVETKQKEEIAKMDLIQTPEVTAGLSQLLSEWSLFRTSGFFGTGPSGKDHALYQKISGLTMAAVIAGRFEGSTPLIKQSIADYMNGWRYEEGILSP